MAKRKALVFAGTWEGHQLADYFNEKGYDGEFCVATEYGSQLLEEDTRVKVFYGRLDLDQMIRKIKKGKYDVVIDATHPYAVIVTENIKKACQETKTPYLRFLRKPTDLDRAGVIEVDTLDAAIEWLNTCEDKVLLTTGSKDLMAYSNVHNFKERIFPRVLPSHASLDLALKANIPSKNIICMQGPFSKEMNIATMNQFGCKIMVSKNTGKQGGMDDKLACVTAGFSLLVIGRPVQEEGFTFEEIVEEVDKLFR